MSFRISRYFAAVALACAGVVLYQNTTIGIAYLFAALGILAPLFIIRVPREFFFLLLFTAGTVWVSHMIRPVVAAVGYAHFMYDHLGTLTDEIAFSALLRIGLYGFLFEMALALGMLPLWTRYERAAPASERLPFLIRAKLPIVAGLAGFVLLRALLLFGMNVGRKGYESNSGFGFILQLIPNELILGLCILYLAKYRSALGRSYVFAITGVLVGYSALLMLGGSKAFLARIALALFIYFLASRGDFKLSVSRAVTAAVVAVLVLLLTFPLGTIVRSVGKSRGYGMEFVKTVASRVPAIVQPQNMKIAVDLVTRRITGYEGYVAVQLYDSPQVERAFSPSATITYALSRLLPGIKPSSMPQGKAISVYYLRLPRELQHSGAVGLFGAMELMAGRFAGASLFLLGLCWGLFFKFVSRFRSADLAFLLQLAGAYAILRWSVSGNFDDLSAKFFVQLMQMAFYGLVAFVLYGIVRRLSVTRPPLLPLHA